MPVRLIHQNSCTQKRNDVRTWNVCNRHPHPHTHVVGFSIYLVGKCWALLILELSVLERAEPQCYVNTELDVWRRSYRIFAFRNGHVREFIVVRKRYSWMKITKYGVCQQTVKITPGRAHIRIALQPPPPAYRIHNIWCDVVSFIKWIQNGRRRYRLYV